MGNRFFLCMGVILTFCFSSSHANSDLDGIINLQKTIIHNEAKRLSLNESIKQDLSLVVALDNQIKVINQTIDKTDKQISLNKRGIKEFPELTSSYKPKIELLKTAKHQLSEQKKGLESEINTLKHKISLSKLESKEQNIILENNQLKLNKLKFDYLNQQAENTIKNAAQTKEVIEAQITTCSFLEIYGRYEGDRQACLSRAIELAKKNAAEKHAPTTIISDIKSHNFQITSESSSQFYAVNVTISEEFKNETWVKMEPEAERFTAQFKAKLKITPVFTEKAHQQLINNYQTKLNHHLARAGAQEKLNTIHEVQKRLYDEEKAKLKKSNAELNFIELRKEIALLERAKNKKDMDDIRHMLNMQQKKMALSDEQQKIIEAEVKRRLRIEKAALTEEINLIKHVSDHKSQSSAANQL